MYMMYFNFFSYTSSSDDFFSSIIWLTSAIFFWKLLDMVRTGKKKWTILKGGIDGFIYFHWFSVISFSNQDHPCSSSKVKPAVKDTSI